MSSFLFSNATLSLLVRLLPGEVYGARKITSTNLVTQISAEIFEVKKNLEENLNFLLLVFADCDEATVVPKKVVGV